jgi:hypothetical protein
VLYPGLTVFDLAGPLQIITGVSELAPQYRVVVVAERVEPMDTDIHVKMIPTHSFAQVPHPFIMLVPGGGLTEYRVWADMPPKGWTKRWARLNLLLPSASPCGWVGTQPQGDVGWLHSLPYHPY